MLNYKNHQRVFMKPATQPGRLNKSDKKTRYPVRFPRTPVGSLLPQSRSNSRPHSITRAKTWDRSGQIGETVTWFVAALIILMVVIIFVFLSFLMSKTKAINVGDVRTDLGKNSDQLTMKTSIAEQLSNNENKQEIEDILKKQNG
jgi:hypothetical protein